MIVFVDGAGPAIVVVGGRAYKWIEEYGVTVPWGGWYAVGDGYPWDEEGIGKATDMAGRHLTREGRYSA